MPSRVTRNHVAHTVKMSPVASAALRLRLPRVPYRKTQKMATPIHMRGARNSNVMLLAAALTPTSHAAHTLPIVAMEATEARPPKRTPHRIPLDQGLAGLAGPASTIVCLPSSQERRLPKRWRRSSRTLFPEPLPANESPSEGYERIAQVEVSFPADREAFEPVQ